MTDLAEPTAAERHAPVEIRSAAVAEVRYADRIVELIAVPYNEETVVPYRGRMVTESILPGAFDGVEARLAPSDGKRDRIPVNRDHDPRVTVGKVVGLHPSRDEGLVAEVRISPTIHGDEALQLAADDVLGASVGMLVREGAANQRWSANNTRRHIVRAFLDHIALVANPAYAGAGVLSVRSGDGESTELWEPPSTPNLDDVLAFSARIDEMLRDSRNA